MIRNSYMVVRANGFWFSCMVWLGKRGSFATDAWIDDDDRASECVRLEKQTKCLRTELEKKAIQVSSERGGGCVTGKKE